MSSSERCYEGLLPWWLDASRKRVSFILKSGNPWDLQPSTPSRVLPRREVPNEDTQNGIQLRVILDTDSVAPHW
jgi:hypothetical protein